ncbi:recombinase family protein [Streptomyces sp. NPDC002790]|uniref:recombinase family protein n=1 Tax=Streptomyces sp. NPDC002790 TaxID=3154431 RepID=UPI0033230C2C
MAHRPGCRDRTQWSADVSGSDPAPWCRALEVRRCTTSKRRSLRKGCHAFLGAGDMLVVPSLDRYGRRLRDFMHMVAELRANLHTATPGRRLAFHVFTALAEFTPGSRASRLSVVARYHARRRIRTQCQSEDRSSLHGRVEKSARRVPWEIP